MAGFVNLHQHTLESHLDAIIKIDALFDRVKELGQSAVAVTDHGSMGGIYKAHKASKRTGVKLIPGNEIYFVTDINAKPKDPVTKKPNPAYKRYHLVLLAANEIGYRNLLHITYEGFKHSVTVALTKKQFPRVDEAILRQYSEGLYALSACGGNIIAQSILTNQHEQAVNYAQLLKSIFGPRFFIELQPHNMQKKDGISQLRLNQEMKRIAEGLNIPMVATCDSHYLLKSDEKFHDMVLAIADKKPLESIDRHRYTSQIRCEACQGTGFTPTDNGTKPKCPACVKGIIGHLPCNEFYVKSEAEVRAYFAEHFSPEFAEQLIANVAAIEQDCQPSDYIAPKGKEHIPFFGEQHISQLADYQDFLVWLERRPDRKARPIDAAYLRYLCEKSYLLYVRDFDQAKKDQYFERLKFEIEVLESKRFCSYMLIVYDYIRWAREHDILTSAGRGSVCGSLAAYFLQIHRVDPLKYGLVFERFINLGKKSLPDVDTDFAPSGRDQVFNYVKEKYGEDQVVYISNVNRITPKVAIKDLCRSLLIGGDAAESFKLANFATSDIPTKATLPDGRSIEVNDIDKAITYAQGNTFKDLIVKFPELVDYARAIIGLPRGYATHAAGVVISDVPIYEYAPVRKDARGFYSVQYDKVQAEENDLVKMDFLGLTTLDIIIDIQRQANAINLNCPTLDEVEARLDDPHTYKLIQSGLTSGCFQMDGSTMQPLCGPMAPTSIQEIAFINALARPSCTDEERAEFIRRKHGLSPPTPPHPILEDILAHTYGISIFEEDLLKLAKKVAGWDYSKADQLRKITKLKEKGADLAKKIEIEFITDSIQNGLSEDDSKLIWYDVVIPYSQYAFNNSHALAYSILGYATAYYKAHFCGPFFSAVINSKLAKRAAKKQTKDKVDESAISLLKKEAKSKAFRIKFSPCDINLSKEYYVSTARKEIKTGFMAIKGLGEKPIAVLLAGQPYHSLNEFILRAGCRLNKNHAAALAKAGAFDPFGVSRKYVAENFLVLKKELKDWIKKNPEASLEEFTPSCADKAQLEWGKVERLQLEKSVLGEYVSGTIADVFPGFFSAGFDLSVEALVGLQQNAKINMQGMIVSFRESKTRVKNKTYVKLQIENLKGENVAVTMWSDEYESLKDRIAVGNAIKGMFQVNVFKGFRSLVYKTGVIVAPEVSV